MASRPKNDLENTIEIYHQKVKEHALAHPVPEKDIPPRDLVAGIVLFNRRYYWECHEVLEDLWMDDYSERRKFLQGLIQASAAFYHVINQNPAGVQRLAQESLKKLNNYRPYSYFLRLEGLCNSLESYISISKSMQLPDHDRPFKYDQLIKLSFDFGLAKKV